MMDGKNPNKGGRDHFSSLIKNTQERTTQQSETSPDNRVVGGNNHHGRPPLFNNKFVRSDDNAPYVSPLAGGSNLRERTLRKAGVAASGSPQTEMGAYGPY